MTAILPLSGMEVALDTQLYSCHARESLQQLSNASSPAESVVSTSSNPGGHAGWVGRGGRESMSIQV